MIFKKVDFLSPPVTLYNHGVLSHSSAMSGVLYIISLLIIFGFGLYYFLKLIKREEPEAFFYNHFIEDAGEFTLNSSSLFHYISLYNVKDPDSFKGFDFESFRLVGIDTYLSYYEADKNLSNFDHWLYGFCNNESDTKGISHLTTHDFLTSSACIKKYFNSSEQKYYDTNDTNFRWPKMAHGTYNSDKEFYVVFMEKCKNETLNIIMGEEYQCKKMEELKNYFEYGVIHFYFIDQYVDVLNYKVPNKKYIYRVENKLAKDTYSQNHLNFNPSIVKTYNGYIMNNIDKEYSYVYDRNDVITIQYSSELKFDLDEERGPRPKDKKDKDKEKENEKESEEKSEEEKENQPKDKEEMEENDNDEIYMAYFFWLGNRMQDYIRNYKKIQDVISDIGGISQVIIIVAGIINHFYNNFIIICDTQNLLSSFSINFEENKKEKSNNSEDNTEPPNYINNENIESNKSISIDRKRDNFYLNNKSQITQKQKDYSHITNVNNLAYIDDKKYKFGGSCIGNDCSKKDKKNNNKETLTFWNYFLYKIGYKKNEIMKNCEDFRIKILSEEYIIKNLLIINRMLNDNNIKDKDNINSKNET